MKSEDSNNPEPQISPEEWVDHFSNLNTLNEKFRSRAESTLLAHEEKLKPLSNLEFQISSLELHSAIAFLKNNKAMGLDSIFNEMLKCDFFTLEKLFAESLHLYTY